MAPRWNKKVDIYLNNQCKAMDFGSKRYVVLVKLA